MVPFLGGLWSSQIQRQKVEWWLLGALGARVWGLLFNVWRVLIWDDENVLELHRGHGCMTE